MANNVLRLSKEALCRGHIAVLTQHRVDQVAIPIYRPVKVAPFATDTHVGFIAIPGSTCFAVAPGAQLFGDKWSEACFPISDCFVSKLKATHQEHLCQVSQTQLISQPPQYNEQDDDERSELLGIAGGCKQCLFAR
jgi:hypothetical protein